MGEGWSRECFNCYKPTAIQVGLYHLSLPFSLSLSLSLPLSLCLALSPSHLKALPDMSAPPRSCSNTAAASSSPLEDTTDLNEHETSTEVPARKSSAPPGGKS